MRELLLPSKTAIKFKETGKRYTNGSSLENVFQNKQETKLFSVELCPNRVLDTEKLQLINPNFCSVTWLPKRVQNSKELLTSSSTQLVKDLALHGQQTLLHLPAKYLRKQDVIEILEELKRFGLRNLFCIRGDLSWPEEINEQNGDFPHAVDLIKFIKQLYRNYFFIGVAGYPEGHPESKDYQEDFYYLKQKVDAGANFIITQMTFEPTAFTNFSIKCKEFEINIPIISGIYVITSYNSLVGITNFCQVKVPERILQFLKTNRNNDEIIEKFGLSLASEFIQNLCKTENTVGYHIFCLNNITAVEKLLEDLQKK